MPSKFVRQQKLTCVVRLCCELVVRFLMKLFCASNGNIVNECRVYFGFKLPTEIIPTRIDKFMSKLSNVVET